MATGKLLGSKSLSISKVCNVIVCEATVRSAGESINALRGNPRVLAAASNESKGSGRHDPLTVPPGPIVSMTKFLPPQMPAYDGRGMPSAGALQL